MPSTIKVKQLNFSALFLFFVTITISMVTTNLQTRELIEIFRGVSIISLIIVLLFIITHTKTTLQHVIVFFLTTVFFSYGYLLSIIHNGTLILTPLLTTITLSFLGSYILTLSELYSNQLKLARWIVGYSVTILLITILFKGLIFEGVPKFVFEYSSLTTGKNILYSQGVSQFFGYSAIASAYLIKNRNSPRRSKLLFLLLFTFMSLSLLGGARGDSVFAIILIFAYILYSFKIRIKLQFFLTISVISIIIINFIPINELIIFKRIDIEGDSFGYRDVLIAQALELLANKPSCLIHGCGFGYFQSYFYYPFEMYPHNFLLELIIVFGLPFTLIFILIVIKGFIVFNKEEMSHDLVILLFIYSTLLALKGGSIITSWLFMTFIVFFFSLAITTTLHSNKNYVVK